MTLSIFFRPTVRIVILFYLLGFREKKWYRQGLKFPLVISMSMLRAAARDTAKAERWRHMRGCNASEIFFSQHAWDSVYQTVFSSRSLVFVRRSRTSITRRLIGDQELMTSRVRPRNATKCCLFQVTFESRKEGTKCRFVSGIPNTERLFRCIQRVEWFQCWSTISSCGVSNAACNSEICVPTPESRLFFFHV